MQSSNQPKLPVNCKETLRQRRQKAALKKPSSFDIQFILFIKFIEIIEKSGIMQHCIK